MVVQQVVAVGTKTIFVVVDSQREVLWQLHSARQARAVRRFTNYLIAFDEEAAERLKARIAVNLRQRRQIGSRAYLLPDKLRTAGCLEVSQQTTAK